MTDPVTPDQRREILRQCEGWFLTAMVHVLHDFPCDQLRIIEKVTAQYLTSRDGETMQRMREMVRHPKDGKEPTP